MKPWPKVRSWITALLPIRFCVLPIAILGWALIWSEEGQGALRTLGEFSFPSAPLTRLTLFVLIVILTGLAAWYWSRQLLRIDFPGKSAVRHPELELWAARVVEFLPFAAATVALWQAGSRYEHEEQVTAHLRFLAGVTLVSGIVFLWFAWWRRTQWLTRRGHPAPQKVSSQRGLAPVTRILLGAAVVCGAVFVAWASIDPVHLGEWCGAPIALFLATSLWISLGSFVVYFADQKEIPIATILIVAASVFSCWNDNHRIKTLPEKLAYQRLTRKISSRSFRPDEE
jgi:hypothetical protein